MIERIGNYSDVKTLSSCLLVLWCADLISSICKCEKFCASHTRFCQALSFQNDSHSSPTWHSPISYTSTNLHCIALDPAYSWLFNFTVPDGIYRTACMALGSTEISMIFYFVAGFCLFMIWRPYWEMMRMPEIPRNICSSLLSCCVGASIKAGPHICGIRLL